MWNQWFIEMEPIASSIPYMVAPGNHEYSCEHPGCTTYSTNFTAYNQSMLCSPSRAHSPCSFKLVAQGSACRTVSSAYLGSLCSLLIALSAVESGGIENMWYSFDYGLVHYVVVSTETDFPNAPEPSTFGDQVHARTNQQRASLTLVPASMVGIGSRRCSSQS